MYGKHLGRSKNQRTALFKGLVQSLIQWEKIETTEAKAKAVKGLIDKLITQAKSENTRRLVYQFLVDKNTQEKLIKDIAPRLKNRTSGYTTITRLGRRLGDGAMMVKISLLTEGESKFVPLKKKDKTEKEKVKTEKSQLKAERPLDKKIKEDKPKEEKPKKEAIKKVVKKDK